MWSQWEDSGFKSQSELCTLISIHSSSTHHPLSAIHPPFIYLLFSKSIYPAHNLFNWGYDRPSEIQGTCWRWEPSFDLGRQTREAKMIQLEWLMQRRSTRETRSHPHPCPPLPSFPFIHLWGFLDGSAVQNPPAVQGMCVWSLGWEDPLGKEMTAHSSIRAWRIPWTERPGGSPWGRKESDTTEPHVAGRSLSNAFLSWK